MNPQCLRALPRAPSSASVALRHPPRPELTRLYATQTGPRPKRRNITVLSDDGRYDWGELSGREKVSRATQQSFNFVVVLAGAVLTGGVAYLFYTDVVSPNSRTWQYEKAVERVKDDARCIKLLGDRREIRAHGETTNSRWARNRPIASTIEKDRLGREHLRMNFHVEGPLNSGIVHVHMMKPLDKNEWEYQLLAVDVKGHSRIILEKASEKPSVASSLKLFGIQWR
ncbi:L-galactonate dehydratase [Penicillium subrubescens]|uniref:Mitochondrial import inner membrane translocase subunit Tim21 n=1 Tax=Penicillium subrubescens TaxID=1316194 RepID=A0A1Q5T5M3_9EURO|nr:L-galactonate dehydratase [Penicillium subrubescens]KAJ5896267.1 L-galactonate dehydratase [Penicillium subrubescens]OKO95537.1 Mitochondrial import inner membrane translocase subunit tim21 [Penicillium subrubescens]